MNVSRYWTLRRRMIIFVEITLKLMNIIWKVHRFYVVFLECKYICIMGRWASTQKPHIIATFSTSPRKSDLREWRKEETEKNECCVFFSIIISSLDPSYSSSFETQLWQMVRDCVAVSKTFERTWLSWSWTKEIVIFIKIHQS